MKLAVPAYFGPWERHHWAMLLDARPSVVVINPASGPGLVPQLEYVPLVEQLRNSGAIVLGYVTTDWMNRSTPECLADAFTYGETYGTTGVLYDEIPTEPSALAPLVRLATGGPEIVVLNPGRQIPDGFRRALPQAIWVTFEGTGRQYLDRYSGVSGAEETNETDWHLVHSVAPSLRPRVLRAIRGNNPDYAYVTRDRMPNPWDVFDPADLSAR